MNREIRNLERINTFLKEEEYLVKKDLVEILNNRTEFYEYMLVLTIVASYYTNSEVLKSNDLPKFTVKVLDCFVKNKFKVEDDTCEWNEHIKYLKKHKMVYDKILLFWHKFLDKNGNLVKGKSIKDILNIIKTDLFEYENFRRETVVHGEGLRLPKKVKKKKYLSNHQKIINSNFVFPPYNYIPELINFLDSILKNPEIDVYEKAAYIGLTIFLTHPFNDGNSRTSRICMVSYLDALGKSYFRFYTFIANFIHQNGNLESYLDFLYRVIYPIYSDKIKPKLKTDLEGNIIEYISLEEYIHIIREVAKELKIRLINIGKEIIKKENKIIQLMKLIKLYEDTFVKYGENSKEIAILKSYLIRIFEILRDKGLDGLKENSIFLSKSRKKSLYRDYLVTDDDIKDIEKIILDVIK